MESPFLQPLENYKRNINFIEGTREQLARYLQLNTGRDYNECRAYADRKIKLGEDGVLRDPEALIVVRDNVGDRSVTKASFMRFIHRVVQSDYLLSPSMAVYCREEECKSTHSEYIGLGVANRNIVKKEMFAAEQAGDADLALAKKGEQNNLKINNNSYSGATVSTATILHYKSTHSSLTSTCRVATSYANAVNEKFLMGNRHYYSPEIVMANVLALMEEANYQSIEAAMTKFNLHYPTTDDVLECVRYSMINYYDSPAFYSKLRSMMDRATPLQRAAVVYQNDLYHLYKHNKEQVVALLRAISTIPEVLTPVSDEDYAKFDVDTGLHSVFMNFEGVNGRAIKDVKAQSPEVWESIKSTGHAVLTQTNHYRDFIEAFMVTKTLPSSIHNFPSIYRKAVPLSDTDSTMFTMQYWVEQLEGEVVFTAQAKQLVFGIVYLISGMISHVLAILSANMGVKGPKLRMLSMKNEYYFAVLSMTTRSKHYYASQDAQEGIMFSKPKLEVKGVGLRSSKVPKEINDDVKKTMEFIINTIKNGDKVEVVPIYKHIADIERGIIDSLNSGEFRYLLTGQIKSADSYKNPSISAYAQYLMWCDVFEPSYGRIKEPPYGVIKVSLASTNPTALREWCESMDDKELGQRLQRHIIQKGKKDLTTLMVPMEIAENHGIPKDIVKGIDVRKIVMNIMEPYYLLIEPLGMFLQDKSISRLVSDYY